MSSLIKYRIYKGRVLALICIFTILLPAAGFFVINNLASSSVRKMKFAAELVRIRQAADRQEIIKTLSEKVKKGTSTINNAITGQKEAIDGLVVSINETKEMSQYFSYLTKQIVKHAAEISDWIIAINKAVKL